MIKKTIKSVLRTAKLVASRLNKPSKIPYGSGKTGVTTKRK